MKKPLLSVIIVNWNTWNLVDQCLRSVVQDNLEGSLQIIVVDNGSSDGSADNIAQFHPLVELLRNEENTGYARANNQGLRMVTAPYVCLLNSDTIVPRGVLKSLVGFLQSNPDAIACAPALRLPDGNLQVGGAGFSLSLASAFNHFMFLSRFCPDKFKGMYIYQDYFVRKGVPLRVDWLVGACLVVRMSAIAVAGALTEEYHMYAEDVEWCQRLAPVGALYFVPGLEITHLVGASSPGGKPSITWLSSTFALYKKQHGPVMTKLFQLIFLLGFGIRFLAYMLMSLNSSKYSVNAREMLVYSVFSVKAVVGL